MKYDAVIIGSGLGGLLCGVILSKEGYRVCVVEKNPKIGGCLQSMRRKSCVFNTGVHYLGCLDEGQVLRQYFKYFGLDDTIGIRRFDEQGFDAIGFDDGKQYTVAMGNSFVERLSEHFPKEREALIRYCEILKEVCDSMPFYSLDAKLFGAGVEKPYLGTSAMECVCSLTSDKRLQQVLFGNDLVYGGMSDKTSLLLYALINHSYMESAWHMSGDSEQIGRVLADHIRKAGGDILCNRTAQRFISGNGNIHSVELHTGEKIEGRYFIANIHPKEAIRMTEPGLLKKAYVRRMENQQNTPGFFVVHMVLKDGTFPYQKQNHYHQCQSEAWPQKFVLVSVGSEQEGGYAKAVSLMALMDYQDVQQWENTVVGHRGADYLAFKEHKASRLMDLADKKFPGLKDATISWYACTPLTYRDYTGTPNGSAYGVQKDCNHPLATMVFPRTGIPNLLFSGQNVYFHGVLGVSIGAVATCSELLGVDYLLGKIRDN